MNSILLAHDLDVFAHIVRVLIMVVSVSIVIVGLRRYYIEKNREHLFAVLLGALWIVIGAVSAIFFDGMNETVSPEVVRPAILVTLSIILAWLMKWCR